VRILAEDFQVFGDHVDKGYKELAFVNILVRSISVSRTCFRCGAEFKGDSKERVCPTCKSPKAAHKLLNPQLSFREKQVISLVAQAKLNKEIAYELHLSEGTIKEYLNRIFQKVGTTNRTELAIWAITNKVQEIDKKLFA
jgi:DNA-binding NarL/FixJ family response regulator